MEFNSWNNGGHIDWLGDYAHGNAHYRTYFTWSVNNGVVNIYPEALISDTSLKFSQDGKSLIDKDKSVYRQIK